MTALELFEVYIRSTQDLLTRPCLLCDGSGKCFASQAMGVCKENCPANCGGSGICSDCRGSKVNRPGRFSALVVSETLAAWIIAMGQVRDAKQFERFNEMWEVVSTWIIELQRARTTIEVAKGGSIEDQLKNGFQVAMKNYLEMTNEPSRSSEISGSALTREELVELGIDPEEP